MKYIDIELSDGTIVSEPIYNVNDFPYQKYKYSDKTVRKRRTTYLNTVATFDIETTTVRRGDDCFGFMYIWQFCLKDTVCMGRTWEEFQTFISKLREELFLSNGRKLVIYVHFLAFEFQFFRNFFEINRVFATGKRDIVIAEIDGYEFRCSYRLSNMGLDKFCKNSKLCTYYKKSGNDFDYSVIRTPNTVLTDKQLEYCYCDVRGLSQCIETLLLDDTIATIPLTSTGYVRRECRHAVEVNPDNYKELQNNELTPNVYMLLRTARRGGNNHANAIYSNEVIINVKSKDKKSSYPSVMMMNDYPQGKFVRIGKPSNIEHYLGIHTACLLDITLYNVSVRNLHTIPYIPKAKCTGIIGARIDNGRVISAQALSIVITDVDYHIIDRHYKWDSITYNETYVTDYAPLNKEFRVNLINYFQRKCELENGDEYLYAKFKNRINALFGMMLTDICHPTIEYTNALECWKEVEPDIESAIHYYYNSRNNFLSYQHGVWVTSHGRAELQKGLDATASDTLYTDTDSVKYIGDHEEDFKRINNEIIKRAEEVDVKAYVEANGKRIYLGVWESDGEYDTFKTIGAKKYAYTVNGKPDIHITVAGLSKISGAKYLNKNGGMDMFKVGTTIPIGDSGRTVSYYNDVDKPYIIVVNGEEIVTGSNIGIEETTYTLGISSEYADFIEYVKPFKNNQ